LQPTTPLQTILKTNRSIKVDFPHFTMSDGPTLTLWANTYMLYPSRLQLYLAEKPLPDSVNINIIYPTFGESTWVVPDGVEPVPQRTLPCLCIQTPDELPQFIHESNSIITYLDTAFARGVDMTGASHSLIQRLRIQDATALVNDVCLAAAVWSINASKVGDMRIPSGRSESAAKFMRLMARDSLLGKLEGWMDEWESDGKFLTGTDEPMIVDCALFGATVFLRRMYGLELLKGRPKLEAWAKRWEHRDSFKALGGPPEAVAELGRMIPEHLM
jgi:glutathione S-transferase